MLTWEIWTARCRKAFQNEDTYPCRVAQTVNSLVTRMNEKEWGEHRKPEETKQVECKNTGSTWMPPKNHIVVKINVDATYNNENQVEKYGSLQEITWVNS